MSDIALVLNGLEESMGTSSVVDFARYINDKYTTFLHDDVIWQTIFGALDESLHGLIKHISITQPAHRFVSELLLRFYPAERVIKYYFAKQHLNLADEVTVFELYVGSSRVDVARVNGMSYAYELKTEFDRLDRLNRQVDDYARVFEHVAVITHRKHLNKVLSGTPEFCGVLSYSLDDSGCSFVMERPTGRNLYVDPEVQVRSLASTDLGLLLKNVGLQVPNKKEERAKLALETCSPYTVNEQFKIALKQRFKKRWQNVKQHFDRIYPVDMQAFYRADVDPRWIYYKRSSIV